MVLFDIPDIRFGGCCGRVSQLLCCCVLMLHEHAAHQSLLKPNWSLCLVLTDLGCCACRLFWSEDQRFLKQFKAGSLGARFKPFSKFPPCYKVQSLRCSGLRGSGCSPQAVQIALYLMLCLRRDFCQRGSVCRTVSADTSSG